ncbi:MATE family efflux transporter [Salipaludibacillus neizhouensis]|uniref:Probable multidrug resistance protein NorM n=1 Tax=Salipaludibacillus neizhouensis TaxID=885475 RepID=A0A3A9KA34_9BACI|nr:MATE family efflux transporter [Salipaludibacillus neizhouensis]RKL67301.1 MATE family efflux transporter [Salipaludibacillus neizhouensis]
MGTSSSLPPVPLQTEVSSKQYMKLAIPLMISTMTTPLLSSVDTAVVGQLTDPSYIGGVAVGSIVFNTLFWVLGFLRLSTSGFTAQAHGANNEKELYQAFIRPFMIAVFFGLAFIIFQEPIRWLSLTVIHPTTEVAEQAKLYFNIRIWSSPFTLVNYVILGWLIGKSYVKSALFIQIGMNSINILLDLLFVHVFNWGVQGVAFASLLAELSAVLSGIILLLLLNKTLLNWSLFSWSDISNTSSFKKMLEVNRDLFIRSVCLLTVYTMFTSLGARMDDTTLAANAILFQIHFLLAYCFGGLSNASSILIGRSIGMKQPKLFHNILKLSAKWGIIFSVALTLSLVAGAEVIISFYTSIPEVQRLSEIYFFWLLLFPIFTFWGIQLNGVFSGATEAAPIRNSLIVSMLVFITSAAILVPIFQNHGLWASFILFSLARSISLGMYVPKLSARVFPEKTIETKYFKDTMDR